MKTIVCKHFPFKGFVALTVYPFLFVREENAKRMTYAEVRNHEHIHAKQQVEMLWLFFFVCYGVEYLVRLVQHCDSIKAYYNISFEREAYAHQSDLNYLTHRNHFAWFNHIVAKNR